MPDTQNQSTSAATLAHTLHIDAPPDLVWAVLVDVERWPEWTPTMTSVVRVDDGPFHLGSTAKIKQPGQPESLWTVTAFVPGQAFTWGTGRTGLQLLARHELLASGAGTESLVTLDMDGALATLLGPILRRFAANAIATENEGLKVRCETLAAEQRTA